MDFNLKQTLKKKNFGFINTNLQQYHIVQHELFLNRRDVLCD